MNSVTFHLRYICRDVLELWLGPIRSSAGFHKNPVRIKNTSRSLNPDQLFFEVGTNYDTF